jgi:SanA protein
VKKALIVLLSVPALIIFNYKIIALSSDPFIHSDIGRIRVPDFIVIPGAGNPDNDKNFFFSSRVEAAAMVYRQFPSVKILCIGRKDNHRYNEPFELKEALIKTGIPDTMILTDTAGFNTFQMLIAIREHYRGRMLFISQRMHLQRILFSAGRMSITAEGYEVTQPLSGRTRKYFRNREIISSLRMTVSLAGYKISRLF